MGLFDLFKKKSDFVSAGEIDAAKGSKVDIIICICYDMPEINQLKPMIQSTIVDELVKINFEITPKTRIIFDSTGFKSLLINKNEHKQFLERNLAKYNLPLHNAEKFVNVGTMHRKGVQPFLATYYVLFE